MLTEIEETGGGRPGGIVYMEGFVFSREDSRERDHWRLRTKWEMANPGSPGKGYLKQMPVCVCVLLLMLLARKRSASDDESEPRPKRRYEGVGHRYEIRLLVQSQVRFDDSH